VARLAQAGSASADGTGILQGDYDASANSPDLDTSPSSDIKKGWFYRVSVAGTFFTQEVQVGDKILALQDEPTALSHWQITNSNNPIEGSADGSQAIVPYGGAASTPPLAFGDGDTGFSENTADDLLYLYCGGQEMAAFNWPGAFIRFGNSSVDVNIATGVGKFGILGTTPINWSGNAILDGYTNPTAAATAYIPDIKSMSGAPNGAVIAIDNGLSQDFLPRMTGIAGELNDSAIEDDGTTIALWRPLEYAKQSVSLTADDTAITVTRNFIEVSSDSGTATDRTFTLATTNMQAGVPVTISWSGANAGEIVSGATNMKLSATWTPDEDDTLSLVFDGTDWLETSRSANS
jgi:hypothetical protein